MPHEDVLQARLIGSPRFSWKAQPVTPRSQKGLALLFYLALRPGGALRRELTELLWDAGRSNNLRQTLYELRRLPGAGAWLESGNPVRLKVASDVQAFEEAALQERYAEALELWRAEAAPVRPPGSLWQNLYIKSAPAFCEWLELERARVGALYLDCLQCRALELEQAGNYGAALRLARELVDFDQLNETAHRLVMHLEQLRGRPEMALKQYALCRRVLAEELGVEPLDETQALLREITGRLKGQHTAPAAAGPPQARPVQGAPFIGREWERLAIGQQLADPECRLLTLTGPGGIGKTRLALRAAAEVQGEGAGVCVVPLAPVASPELIVSAVAGALGLTFGDLDNARSQLLRALNAQRLLLVLDNFEHLLAGADLITDILANAPQVKLLVTSRERLNLQSEWLFEVRGLAYPEAAGEAGTADLQDYDALRLFAQSARRTQFDFRLTGDTAPQVLRICRLLEGVPLGLELAAAWVRLLPCGAIADELSQGLELLNSSSRDAPARHQSMRVVFDHSWQRLSAAEQQALTRLSVFRGGFGRRAAKVVAGAPLQVLLKLVDKSLLSSEPGRFDMLEVTRQYGLEKLGENPELKEATEAAHCRYYGTLLASYQEELEGASSKAALDRVAAELDNIRAAWYHAAETGRADVLWGSAASLATCYDLWGLFEEGAELFAKAAEGLGPTGSGSEVVQLTLTRLWLRESWFFFRLGRYPRVRDLLERSLAIFRQQGKPLGVASCLYQLGNVAEALGEYEEATCLLRESLAGYRRQGHTPGLVKVLNSLGLVAYALGHYEEARALHLEGLPLREKKGDSRALMIGYNNLGDATLRLGEPEEAARLYRQGLAISRSSGDAWGLALSRCHLGDAAYAQGLLDDAGFHYREAVALCEEIGMSYALSMALRGLGKTCAACRDGHQARALLARSLEIASSIRATPQAVETLVALAQLERQEGNPARSAELGALALEHGGQQAHAKALARQLLDDLEGELSEGALERALAQAGARRLEDAISELLTG